MGTGSKHKAHKRKVPMKSKRLISKHWHFSLYLINRNYWIGVRYSFMRDGWECNLFGLMLVVYSELFEDAWKGFDKVWEFTKDVLLFR